jgi:hypothetical protein
MIEVLRLIRYRYADVETMVKDRERWSMNHYSPRIVMESVVLSPTLFPVDEPSTEKAE